MSRSSLVIKILLFILAFGCTTLNKNMTKKGTYTIGGGVYQNQRWDDDLVFDRVSWFKELTLSFDLFYTKVEKDSPFYQWFSDDEKRLVEQCLENYVVLTYAWDPMQISREGFFAEVLKQGYERLSIPNFHQNVKMHPNFARINVYLYKTNLICRRKLGGDPLIVSFPGFKSVKL
jgi:hypothetical protein